MATKKKAAAKAVVPVNPPKQTTALTTGDWRERARDSINKSKQALAKLPLPGGNFLSFRGGVITYGGNKLENPLPVILLAHGFERTYYAKDFDPDTPATPECYSFDNERPHEKSSVPQSETCERCRLNEFGTDNRQKGKGCKEGARLVMMHANQAKSPESILKAQLVMGRLSVLNAKTFRAFGEAAWAEEPTWGSILLISNQPDAKSQYAVSFESALLEDPSDEIMAAIESRLDEAERLLVQPYQEIVEQQKPAQAQPARRRKF